MSTVPITVCSAGFGEALALAFAKQGDNVVAVLRRPEEAPPSIEHLVAERRPSAATIAALDVNDADARRRGGDLSIGQYCPHDSSS